VKVKRISMMKISDLRPGMLLKPRDGFSWWFQASRYMKVVSCLTVVRNHDEIPEACQAIMYLGPRKENVPTYGKQIVLWDGSRVSVNPAAWRNIVPLID